MVPGADRKQSLLREKNEANGPVFKIRHDPRFTRVGTFLAHTGLDELPQLINVALGEMSIVGPRPCIPYEYERYAPHHRERLEAVPGLTGLLFRDLSRWFAACLFLGPAAWSCRQAPRRALFETCVPS